MALEEEAELDALLQALARPEADAEYPLPEEKPVKYTNVDVVVLPHGYKSEYPKPEQKDEDEAQSSNDSIAQFTDSFELKLVDPVPIVTAGRCRVWVTSNETGKEDIAAGDYLEIADFGGSNALPIGASIPRDPRRHAPPVPPPSCAAFKVRTK
jgi:hypothetical protein